MGDRIPGVAPSVCWHVSLDTRQITCHALIRTGYRFIWLAGSSLEVPPFCTQYKQKQLWATVVVETLSVPKTDFTLTSVWHVYRLSVYFCSACLWHHFGCWLVTVYVYVCWLSSADSSHWLLLVVGGARSKIVFPSYSSPSGFLHTLHTLHTRQNIWPHLFSSPVSLPL